MQEPFAKPEIPEDFICPKIKIEQLEQSQSWKLQATPALPQPTIPDKGKEKIVEPSSFVPKPLLALNAPSIFPLTGIISDFSEPLSETEARALNLTDAQKEHLKDWLWSFVEQSKTDETIAPQASKAITTLNAMGVGFMGKYGNLENVKIPGANLKGALLTYTCLKGADLKSVQLGGAYLGYTDFTQANLTGVDFGEWKTLQYSGAVVCVCYSADGQYLAVGTEKNIELHVNQIGAFHRLAILQGHTKRVLSVAFSPNGQLLASGGVDKTVRLWNTKTHQLIATLQGRTGVSSVSFSPNGRELASGSTDNTVCLWSTETYKAIATLQGHKEWVNSVSFSPDGQQLASASDDDDTIRLWNTKIHKAIATLQGHTYAVNSVSFSPNGWELASGSTDNTVRLWNTKIHKAIATLQGHTGSVLSVSFSPDGQQLASGGADNTVRLWDTKTYQPIATLQGHTGSVYSVSFSPDGLFLLSGSRDCVFLWIKIPAPSIAQEKWALVWRYAPNSLPLLAENAFLKGAKISENNLKLLKQRGANDDQTPDYENNPHKFWSKVLSPKAESDDSTADDQTPEDYENNECRIGNECRIV